MARKVFQALDEATFKGVDQIKAQPQFHQISTALEGLPDEYQKYINQGLTYLISFFPVIIFLVTFIFATMAHNQVGEREELIEAISRYNEIQAQTQSLGASLVGRTALPDQVALETKLGSFTSAYSLKRGAIKVLEFSNDNYGNLIETRATIVFNGLSTPKFLALLEDFAISEKAKFHRVSLKKVKDTLQGELTFNHYSRTAP